MDKWLLKVKPTTDESSDIGPSGEETSDQPSAKKPCRGKLGFQESWMSEYPWVRYNEERNGMLCDTCITYASSGDNYDAQCSGKWINEVVQGLKNGKAKIKKHENSDNHKAVAKKLAKEQTGKQGSVVDIAIRGMAAANRAEAISNRKNVKKLLRCVYYLCRRKTALFGDSFNNTCELTIENGDTDLGSWLKNAPRNATYTSNQVIEEYLLAISEWLERPILASLKGSSIFTLMADESTDIAVIEEMSICARWFSSEGKVVEHFLGLLDLKSCNAETISNALVGFMQKKGIDVTHMRAQGYDGASTMAGKLNGAQMRIRAICSPKAIYCHCRAHLLQLALVDSSKQIRDIKSVLTTMMSIWKTFHYSPKKACRLAEIQAVLNHPSMKMIKLSDTRWSAYERCVTAIRKSLPALIQTFEHLYTETSEPEALGILKSMKTYRFVAALLLLSDALPHVIRLSKLLQSKNMDVTFLHGEVHTCVAAIQNLRDDCTSGNFLSQTAAV